ncbi:hypothetical protein AAGS61_08770 [Lysinibacillus sp. KU-BSD001]|uniref:hypothetical protein n=1 Tax=Lysinibacillus sp. KU-BSD001 TaxID=3141328 RepID=UPI0036EABDE3
MKVINIVGELIITLYFYTIFYLIILLMTNIDILEKILIIVCLVFLLGINSKIEGIIDFISSTAQIMSIALISVIIGLYSTLGALKVLEYVILNSKYYVIINEELNAALMVLLVIVLWFILSYFLFYLAINLLRKMEFKEIKMIVLNKQHYKVLEAGTVLAGFLSLLVSIIIAPELNSTINKFILGIYLLCLIPFLYFHFNEDLIEK